MANIYSLTCPQTQKIIYVGQTKGWLKYRLSHHISQSKTHGGPLYKYIRENDIIPEINSLEFIDSDDKNILDIAENKWILKFISEGVAILNIQTKIEKSIPISIYSDTLNMVKECIKYIPGMTISRFVDEAAKEKLKTIYEQKNAGLSSGGTNNSEDS